MYLCAQILSIMRKIFTLVAAILMTACLCAQSWSAICTYSGYVQPLTVPTTGLYKLQVWGAQGGKFGSSNAGALGGYATCYAQLTAGETIYIYVGGKGGDGVDAAGGNGGWNGGGHGGFGVAGYHGSAGGGGATHISKVNNQVIGSGSGQCASLVGTNYIIVAGGGGGAGHSYTSPGAGFKPLVDSVSTAAVVWIISEGVCYITGALFYSLNKRKYMHSVFHFFVLAGSVCHIIAVWDVLMQYL